MQQGGHLILVQFCHPKILKSTPFGLVPLEPKISRLVKWRLRNKDPHELASWVNEIQRVHIVAPGQRGLRISFTERDKPVGVSAPLTLAF